MTAVAIRPEEIRDAVAAALGDKVRALTIALDEVTLVVSAADYLQAMHQLRDAPGCRPRQSAASVRPGRSSTGDSGFRVR